MKNWILFLLTLALGGLVTGCSTSTVQNLNSVSVGMSKAEVIQTMGTPEETRAAEGTEYLIYKLRRAPSSGTQTGCATAGLFTYGLAYLVAESCRYQDNDYFVQLNDGKVTAYGKIGDFNSTAKPEATINVNQNIKTQ
jgi:hypothetical protein